MNMQIIQSSGAAAAVAQRLLRTLLVSVRLYTHLTYLFCVDAISQQGQRSPTRVKSATRMYICIVPMENAKERAGEMQANIAEQWHTAH